MASIPKIPRLVGEEVLQQWYGKRVLKRNFELPDGTISDFYVFGGTIPVIIFPLTQNKEVITVRQFRYGANKFILELPGGNIKPGETAEEAVKKELLEETGYIARARRIIQLSGPIWFDPASFTVAFWPFLVLGCRKAKKPEPEKTEIMETVLIPLEEWINMVSLGKIEDSKTLAVTLLVLACFNRLG